MCSQCHMLCHEGALILREVVTLQTIHSRWRIANQQSSLSYRKILGVRLASFPQSAAAEKATVLRAVAE